MHTADTIDNIGQQERYFSGFFFFTAKLIHYYVWFSFLNLLIYN